MKKIILTILLVAVIIPLAIVADAQAASDGVVAMYFHRTQRCPTCKTIGSYAEEAVTQGFADQDGVSFHFVDYQNSGNANMTAAYKVQGPTLVLAKVRDGRVVVWRPMPNVWQLVGDKDAFLEYVRDGVTTYLED